MSKKPHSEEGMVLQLQKFSVHDGDGVRTVVFLSGCPLRCLWCANPEGWNISSFCQRASVGEVIKQIERDEIFFRYSGGGITFSGGEPTVQEGFLRALAQAFHQRGISIWMETCGYFEWEKVKDIFKMTDHVFYDIKCMDAALHRDLTGADNALILENCVKLYHAGHPVTIRIPAVKGANFTDENMEATARFMSENLPGSPIELLPYHTLGLEKYRALGMTDEIHPFSTPSREEIKSAYETFRRHGVAVVEYR